MTTNPSIAIIGGGPGGLMLARLLQRGGRAVTVFERDSHAGARPQGGSLDLHAETGQRAMRLAGLEAEFMAEARPEDQGDRLYDSAGRLVFDHDGAGHDRPEIDRTALRTILLAALAPGTVRWGSPVEAILPSGAGWEVIVDGRAQRFDVVVGADGVWSRVRPLLSDAVPAYEGATLFELGFDVERHPRVDALTGHGKMFAAGDNRLLIAQRNGAGHIRGYAGLRVPEATVQAWQALPIEEVRGLVLAEFAGWSPELQALIAEGDALAIRPMVALPIGHRWETRQGVTLLGDAAHVMSPFSGEGVNLALADAADLAEALLSNEGWEAVARYEVAMADRAAVAAEGAAQGLRLSISPDALDAVLEHYRERVLA